MRDVLRGARSRWRGLALWFCACMSVAVAYVLLATPEFVATTQVVLEPRQPVIPIDSATSSTTPALDSAQADSQVEVLQSERNLRYVFDTLELAKDPEFTDNGFDLIGWLQRLLPVTLGTTPLPPKDAERRARDIAYTNFAERVTVRRLAQSYAFELSFRALSPKKAAHLANSITAAYIRDQVIYNVASAAAQRGGDYLQNRISDAKTEEEVADNAIKTGVIPDFTFGHADARIVSAAFEPLTKSYPMTAVIVALSALGALTTGVGALVVRDELDRKVRSREQVRRLTGIDVFAVIPRVENKLGHDALLLREALDTPASPFAHAMRALRTLALTAASGSRYVSVGFVSCRPREGRSSIAANVAYLIADAGQPVTLLDLDVRNPALTKALAPTAASSLSEFAMTRRTDAIGLQLAVNSTLAFLPAVSISSEHDPNLFMGSRETLQGIMALAAERNVIVDLPPLSTSADSLAVGRSLTGVIVVAALHKTTLDDLADLVRTLDRSSIRILGVILNEAASER